MEKIEVREPDELDVLSRNLLGKHPTGRVFAFFGEMGSGKTTFIKAFCKALDVKENVSSPTFSIINEYRRSSGEPVFHFDFYRIENPQEAVQLGLNDYFFSGHYCFVEWAEKILHLLPEERTDILIKNNIKTRQISIHYGGRTV